MNIILTEKVNSLGKLGDVVKVKDGYARNYLLPQGKAIRATKDNLENFSKEKSKREADNENNKKVAQKLSESLIDLSIVILRPASETGQLYGSVSTRNIADSISKKDFSIMHKQVILEKPVKELGIQKINISLHPEVIVSINLNVARTMEEAKTQEKTGFAVVETKEEGEDVPNLVLENPLESDEDENNSNSTNDDSHTVEKEKN
jgi:large subunit ribosomal protein L9